MKPQFAPRRHLQSRETHRGAGAVRKRKTAAQIFQPVLPPLLLPQELLRYDLLDVMLPLFGPGDMAKGVDLEADPKGPVSSRNICECELIVQK